MKKYMLIIIFAVIFWECNSDQKIGEIKLDEGIRNQLEIVSNLKIYFGHQSVGNNIMEGLKEIHSEYPEIPFTIIDSSNALPDSGGFFLHTRIGENTKPDVKCDDFIRQLNPNLAEQLDYAMFKFCYIDINRDTDVNTLFEYYKNTINKVKKVYPDLRIIHITAPLRHSPDDLKTKIREIIGSVLGKQNNSKLDNFKRNEFNRLMVKEYTGERLFDLARMESTYPDGQENTFQMNGKINYNLIAEYTYDGGHLNELGRKKVGTDLIKFLSSLSK